MEQCSAGAPVVHSCRREIQHIHKGALGARGQQAKIAHCSEAGWWSLLSCRNSRDCSQTDSEVFQLSSMWTRRIQACYFQWRRDLFFWTDLFWRNSLLEVVVGEGLSKALSGSKKKIPRNFWGPFPQWKWPTGRKAAKHDNGMWGLFL